MLVIGLTGGIGSGKSTVAELFAAKNVTVIDTDQLAREVTAPSKPALAQITTKFGHSILLPDGSLNRSKLRKIVFSDGLMRQWLEQLLHPLIREAMKERIEASTSPYCIVVIPLLFETAPNPLIQRILTVDAKEEQQIARTTERDKLTPDEVNTILKTQVSREKRLSQSDDVIYNSGSLDDLSPQIDTLHKLYLALAKQV